MILNDAPYIYLLHICFYFLTVEENSEIFLNFIDAIALSLLRKTMRQVDHLIPKSSLQALSMLDG